MAGEPLLRRSVTGLVFVAEIEPPSVSTALTKLAAEEAFAIGKAADLPALELHAAELNDALCQNAVTSQIATLQRRVILLCGGLLEGAVTQVALSALVDGFDVFICADLVSTAEPEREQLFFNRITASCGHILTRRQVILELLAQEADDARRQRLARLLTGAAS